MRNVFWAETFRIFYVWEGVIFKMTRPMTTEELFDRVHGILKEKNLIPEILDYSLATHRPVPVKTYEFDLKSNLNYGGNEGIYLDLWIDCNVEGEIKKFGLGTYKTLLTNEEAMHIMAKLLADWIITEYDYVNSHLDDFTWFGADVFPIGEDGERCGFGYSCGSMESALQHKDELLLKYARVMIRDNVTRKETIFVSK